jgi:hypothetical protein
MITVLGAALGLMVAGPFGALAGAATPLVWSLVRRPRVPDPPITLILLLLLVELRSGLSVLAALTGVSASLPAYESLRRVSRLARVTGLVGALPYADDRLRPVMAQLARAQRSGASLGGTVRQMLESELAAERSRRIARARTLPVQLMIPVTLLMLPGMVLVLYAPSLLETFGDLTGVLG